MRTGESNPGAGELEKIMSYRSDLFLVEEAQS